MNRTVPVVEATNQSTTHQLDLDRWSRVAADTLAGEGVTGGCLDLLFVDVAEITELNRDHLGNDKPTDVLSFPLDEPHDGLVGGGFDQEAEGSDLEPLPIHLGDIVICPAVADAQAGDHCGDLDSELTLLIVHGVLHILGHDHAEPEEQAVMIDREEHHLARYGIAHPGPQE